MQERWHRMNNKDHTISDIRDDFSGGTRNGKRSRSRSPLSSAAHQSRSSDAKQFSKSDANQNEIKESSSLQSSAARQAERAAERERRCLPKIRDKHLTVCSSTLWLGHLPKSVSEVDISDAFGEYGTISSIDLVPPRGCAYVCMDRRQDAKRALDESKDLKLKNSHIKMAWAPGKGFKEYKKLKDFWESDVGASFIPYSKVDHTIDFDVLEEGGVIDEDSMSMEIRERREQQAREKKMNKDGLSKAGLGLPLPPISLMNQPTPTSIQPFAIPPPNLGVPPPTSFSQGLIPFPPPSSAASGNHMSLPPPSSFLLSQNATPSANYRDNLDAEKLDGLNSPQTIEQQLSMTERQISMVEQQLSMIQQAQGVGRGAPMQSLPPMQHTQQVFHHTPQPNPMMFDLSLSQPMFHAAQNMMDPSLAMYASHPSNAMAQMMVPTSLAADSAILGMNESFNEHNGSF
uniref:Protein SCAF8 n=1 Tax=Aceria tosichella TaxID=561515 RepID=A0A6G1S7D6_9ACAR